MSNRVLNPGQSEKIKLNFYFHTLCGTSKGFMKGLKGQANMTLEYVLGSQCRNKTNVYGGGLFQ